MKMRLTFKTPDVTWDVLKDASETMSEEEYDKVEKAVKKWVWCGECLTVEIDSETGSCTAIPAPGR